MKKIIIVLPLLSGIDKAFAGHVVFSKDEYYLEVIIPALIILIWWMIKIIRKKYISNKTLIMNGVQDQDRIDPDNENETILESEIPEFFKEKDVFGLDKPSINLVSNENLQDTFDINEENKK